jgi:hypothetical protein
MKLSKSTIGMVAESIAKSKTMLMRAHQQIAKCRAGLETLTEISMKRGDVPGGYNRH